MTHYEALGIEENATQEQIRAAYRTLVKKYHPDVNDAANANAFFRLIQEAYEILGDPQKRNEYDNSESVSKKYDDYTYDNKENNSSYNDNYTYEAQTPRSHSNIALSIVLIPVKIIALTLIPIVAFLCQICKWITAAIFIISRLHVGFCLPHIVSAAPAVLTLAKGYLKKFVFGHASEFDEADDNKKLLKS